MNDLKLEDIYLTARDRQVMELAGYGAQMGFGERPALLVVDVTYGFCGDKPEAILDSVERWPNSCGEDAWIAMERIKKLLSAFRCAARPIIYTRNDYRDDKWDMGSWLWKHSRMRPQKTPAIAAGPAPDELVADIAPDPSDLIIRKLKPSAFFSTPLQSHLTLLGVDSLVVAGGSTSGCVRATVVDAFSANFRVAVAADACFDRIQASHAMSLIDMQAKYADVVSVDLVLQHMRSMA